MSSSFTIISVGHLPTQPHKDRISIHKMDLWDHENKTNIFLTFQVQLACIMEAEDIMLFLLPRRIQVGEKRIERKPKGRLIGRRKKMKGGISLHIFTEPISLDRVF